MVRDEVSRLVDDISRAILRSDLLSLLQRQDHQPDGNSQKLSLLLRRHRSNHNDPRNNSTISLSEIPKSILDDRVQPIRTALENIDAQKLLDLEIFREQKQPSVSQERISRGPRVRDGVFCRPICDQIRPTLQIDNDDDDDVAMGNDDYDSNNKSSVVRYLHIAEVPDEYTIGIFVFGPHQRIPLHDHPEMCVLSRVLYGDLQRLSLDLDRNGRTPNDEGFDFGGNMNTDDYYFDDDDDDDDDEVEEEDPNEASSSSIRNFLEKQSYGQTESKNSSNNGSSSSFFAEALSRSATWFQHNLYNNSSSNSGITMHDESESPHYNNSHQQQYHNVRGERRKYYPEGTKVAYQNAIDVLEAPNVASLYPYEGNLHEFVAGPHGAAVLDVLLPPYDDERTRDCTFYNIRELNNTSSAKVAKREQYKGSSNGVTSKAATHTSTIATHNNPASATSTSMATSRKDERNQNDHCQQQQQQHRDPCLIVPTGQPENFHCISGLYKDLGETDDVYDYQSDDE